MGIVALASLAAVYISRTARNDDIYIEPNQLGDKRGKAIRLSLIRSPLNDNIFPLDVSKLAQTLTECLVAAGLRGKRGTGQESYAGDFPRLLRLGCHCKSKQHHCNKD